MISSTPLQTLFSKSDLTDLVPADTHLDFSKTWKKFVLWWTSSNKSYMENIHDHYDFIMEYADDELINQIARSVYVKGPLRTDFGILIKTIPTIIDALYTTTDKCFKSGTFLTLFDADVNLGFNIPECTQFVPLWKKLGVDLEFSFSYKYYANMNFKEYNKLYANQQDRQLFKLGYSNLKDIDSLVDTADSVLTHVTNNNLRTEHMYKIFGFPRCPKGLTLTKTEEELVGVNIQRFLAIYNSAYSALIIQREIVYFIDHWFMKIKSEI